MVGKGKKAHPLSARIKKLMQSDEDVGKIASATPVLIGRAMELFLKRLCENAGRAAVARQAKTLTPSHLKYYVQSDPIMDFLKDTFSGVPDLTAEPEADLKVARKQARGGEPRHDLGPTDVTTSALPPKTSLLPAHINIGRRPRPPHASNSVDTASGSGHFSDELAPPRRHLKMETGRHYLGDPSLQTAVYSTATQPILEGREAGVIKQEVGSPVWQARQGSFDLEGFGRSRLSKREEFKAHEPSVGNLRASKYEGGHKGSHQAKLKEELKAEDIAGGVGGHKREEIAPPGLGVLPGLEELPRPPTTDATMAALRSAVSGPSSQLSETVPGGLDLAKLSMLVGAVPLHLSPGHLGYGPGLLPALTSTALQQQLTLENLQQVARLSALAQISGPLLGNASLGSVLRVQGNQPLSTEGPSAVSLGPVSSCQHDITGQESQTERGSPLGVPNTGPFGPRKDGKAVLDASMSRTVKVDPGEPTTSTAALSSLQHKTNAYPSGDPSLLHQQLEQLAGTLASYLGPTIIGSSPAGMGLSLLENQHLSFQSQNLQQLASLLQPGVQAVTRGGVTGGVGALESKPYVGEQFPLSNSRVQAGSSGHSLLGRAQGVAHPDPHHVADSPMTATSFLYTYKPGGVTNDAKGRGLRAGEETALRPKVLAGSKRPHASPSSSTGEERDDEQYRRRRTWVEGYLSMDANTRTPPSTHEHSPALGMAEVEVSRRRSPSCYEDRAQPAMVLYVGGPQALQEGSAPFGVYGPARYAGANRSGTPHGGAQGEHRAPGTVVNGEDVNWAQGGLSKELGDNSGGQGQRGEARDDSTGVWGTPLLDSFRTRPLSDDQKGEEEAAVGPDVVSENVVTSREKEGLTPRPVTNRGAAESQGEVPVRDSLVSKSGANGSSPGLANEVQDASLISDAVIPSMEQARNTRGSEGTGGGPDMGPRHKDPNLVVAEGHQTLGALPGATVVAGSTSSAAEPAPVLHLPISAIALAAYSLGMQDLDEDYDS